MSSPYGLVSVVQEGDRLYLKLGDHIQSAIDQKFPYKMIYTYSQLISFSLLLHRHAVSVNPNFTQPVEVLMIGLGGGTMVRHIDRFFPHFRLTTVEINPQVVYMAKKYFHLPKKAKIITMDGYQYLKKSTKRFDILILDAFSKDYIPKPFHSELWHRIVRAHLKPNGLYLINTWVGHKTEKAFINRVKAVFGLVFSIVHPDKPWANRILIIPTDPALKSITALKRRIKAHLPYFRFTGYNGYSFLPMIRAH